MSTFYAKSSAAQDRQLKCQRLTIPLTVTHSATAANVVLNNDENSVLFMQSQGVDQITPADSVTAAEYSDTTPTDSAGQLNIMLIVGESAKKVSSCRLRNRTTGAEYAIIPDAGSVVDSNSNPTGVSTDGNIMLSVATTVDFTSTDLNACLEVDYVVVDGN